MDLGFLGNIFGSLGGDDLLASVGKFVLKRTVGKYLESEVLIDVSAYFM